MEKETCNNCVNKIEGMKVKWRNLN